MIKVIDTKFAFPKPSVPGSFCRLRIYQQSDGLSVVLMSQIPGSRGRSITNAIEEVATQVMRDYQEYLSLPAQEVIWVQHYPPGSLSLETDDRVHLVMFDRSTSGFLTNPCWTHVTKDHTEASILLGLINQ